MLGQFCHPSRGIINIFDEEARFASHVLIFIQDAHFSYFSTKIKATKIISQTPFRNFRIKYDENIKFLEKSCLSFRDTI